MISVIMSTYNEPLEYIDAAVDSILNQTYRDIEYIIIVDNPDRKELVNFIRQKKVKDSRIKMVVNEMNIGLTASLNKGLAIASGKYIARMDADDISKSDRFEAQLALMERGNLDLVGCNVKDIDGNGDIVRKSTNLPTVDRAIKKYLKIDSAVLHPTWLARREIFENNLYIDFPACEDYELLTRLALQGRKFGNVSDPKLYYRLNNSGISSTKRVQQKVSKYFIANNYRRGRFSDLTSLRDYVNSVTGKKKHRALSRYYDALPTIKDNLKKHRIKGLIQIVGLLTVSFEAKEILFNKLKKKIIVNIMQDKES